MEPNRRQARRAVVVDALAGERGEPLHAEILAICSHSRRPVEWLDGAVAGVFLAWKKLAVRGSDELAMRLESVTELLTSIRRALADVALHGAALRPCVERCGPYASP